MLDMKSWKPLAAAALICAAAACTQAPTTHSSPVASAREPRTAAGVELFVGDTCHCVDLADTQSEREQGLAPDGDPYPFPAMVFSWEEPSDVGFWMKGTKGPLQIAFSDAKGVVAQTSSLSECLGDSCPVTSSPAPTQLAVEARNLQALGIRQGVALRLGAPCTVST
jgi:uncharacterized membrane protein (UPF0127 family)